MHDQTRKKSNDLTSFFKMLIRVGKRNKGRVWVWEFYSICPGHLGLSDIDITLDLAQDPPCGAMAITKKISIA